jgi:hypothetical protein
MKQFGKNSEEALGKVSSAAPKATSALDSLKSSYLQITVAAAAAFMTLQEGMDYMVLGAKAIQAEESFRAVAKANNESVNQIVEDMKRVSAGTIDASAIMQKAVKGMALGLTGNEMVNILEAARMAARLTGEDVEVAYEKITDAISTNMPRGLRQYGLITKEQFAIVNKALSAGVEDVRLYELAMANAAETAKKLTSAERNLSEEIQRGQAAWKARREEAGKLLDSLIVLYGKFDEWDKKNQNTVPLWWRLFGSPADIAQAQQIMNQINNIKPMTDAQRFDAQKGDTKIKKTPEQIMSELKAQTDQIKAIEDAKRLMEAWKEMERTLNAKIEGGGLSEFKKDLIANQLEADKLTEKFGNIKGAIKLIQKAQDAENTDAIKKAENKALEVYENRIKEETEKDKHLYEKRQQEAQERLTSERDIYKDLRGYEDSYYAASSALIEKQADRYRELKINEVAIEAWATEEKRKAQLLLYRTVSGAGTFGGGWNEGLRDWYISLGTEFSRAEELAKTTATSMSSNFSNLFFDIAKGQCKDFYSYFSSFMDAILRKVTDNMANMVTQWILGIAKMQNSQSGSGLNLGGLGSLFSSIFGGGGSGAASLTYDSAAIASSSGSWLSSIGGFYFHQGGIVGESLVPTRMMPALAFAGAPRLHSGLASDEFPAILQRGEAVIPRNQVNTGSSGGGATTVNNHFFCWDSKSLEDFVKRNAGIFQNNTIQGLRDNKTRSEMKNLLR